MAQRVVTTLVSDLSGKELGDDGQTIKFGFLGVDYELDISQEEADDFAAVMEKYVSVARRVGGRKQTGSGTTRTDPAQTKAMREWANSNGFKVSSRGRIPQEVQDAYQKALSTS